jgi:hypothetical protein
MPKSKEQKQKEAIIRDEANAKLTLDQKIQKQVDGHHSGKQLRRYLKLKAEQNKG